MASVTRDRRGRRFGAGLAALLFVVLLPAAPAQAAQSSACAVSGVTVVVDFSSFGLGIQVACAAGDPSSGLDALHAAGFRTQGTTQSGPRFVCRINDLPTFDVDKCVSTSPATAYWSYWRAKAGGTWSYSDFGVLDSDPAPGDVEGWAYGAKAKPGIAPPAAPAPPPKPPATTHTTPPTVGTGMGPGPLPAVTEDPSGTPSASLTPEPTTPASDASTPAASPIAGSPPAPSSPLGTLIGVAAVVVVAAAGGLVALRRRRATPPAPHPHPDDN